MRVRLKTLFQLAGIVACLGMMLIPGPAHAATLRSFNMTIPAAIVKVTTTPVVTVKAGDSLSKLAHEYRLPWQGVYCTNKKVIGPNPNLLRIGERLVMKSTSCGGYSGYGNTAKAITAAEYNTSGTPQQIAWKLLANFGGNRSAEYYCLNHIIVRESGWRVTAYNPSGAYGIPQALPGSKMSAAGPNWQYSAYTQLRWMIKFYIPATYHTPCGAWSFWKSHNWY